MKGLTQLFLGVGTVMAVIGGLTTAIAIIAALSALGRNNPLDALPGAVVAGVGLALLSVGLVCVLISYSLLMLIEIEDNTRQAQAELSLLLERQQTALKPRDLDLLAADLRHVREFAERTALAVEALAQTVKRR